MRREVSAGGVLARATGPGRWEIAAISPAGRRGVWALPKGNVGRAERAEEAALREIEEETGARGELLEKLEDVRYVYTWRGERVFKVVSFFLVRYTGGELGAISPDHAREVDDVCWLPLEEAPRLLGYGGERRVARKAAERLSARSQTL